MCNAIVITMIQAFLIDYGGTLDTAARHWSYVLHEGYDKAGIKLENEVFRPAYVYAERALARHPYIRSNDDFFDLLLKKVSLEIEYLEQHGSIKFISSDKRAVVAEQVALYCNAYARNMVHNTIPILERLANNYRLVMVSNFYGNLTRIVNTYGIAPYFEAIVESAVVGVRKPDPAIWQMGVEAARAKASECVVVGDSYSKDILPGHSLGCETVWFKGEEWENVSRDETLPTHVITALPEILEYYG